MVVENDVNLNLNKNFLLLLKKNFKNIETLDVGLINDIFGSNNITLKSEYITEIENSFFVSLIDKSIGKKNVKLSPAILILSSAERLPSVVDSLKSLSRGLRLNIVYLKDSADLVKQKAKLSRSIHILVAEPVCLAEILAKGGIKLDDVKSSFSNFLDEFNSEQCLTLSDIILKGLPSEHQRLCFFHKEHDGIVDILRNVFKYRLIKVEKDTEYNKFNLENDTEQNYQGAYDSYPDGQDDFSLREEEEAIIEGHNNESFLDTDSFTDDVVSSDLYLESYDVSDDSVGDESYELFSDDLDEDTEGNDSIDIIDMVYISQKGYDDLEEVEASEIAVVEKRESAVVDKLDIDLLLLPSKNNDKADRSLKRTAALNLLINRGGRNSLFICNNRMQLVSLVRLADCRDIKLLIIHNKLSADVLEEKLSLLSNDVNVVTLSDSIDDLYTHLSNKSYDRFENIILLDSSSSSDVLANSYKRFKVSDNRYYSILLKSEISSFKRIYDKLALRINVVDSREILGDSIEVVESSFLGLDNERKSKVRTNEKTKGPELENLDYIQKKRNSSLLRVDFSKDIKGFGSHVPEFLKLNIKLQRF